MEKQPPFRDAMEACFRNGDRLVDEVRDLLDWTRPQSALVLSVIAQEEFAKGFLLHLVDVGLVPWHPLVQRAGRDHACKHLLGLVMDYLNPEFEEFMARFNELAATPEPFDGFPGPVADALNILRHEKIGRWQSHNWVWAERPGYDRTAKHVSDGEYDRQKQDALYVRLSSLGGVASTPERVTMQQATEALDRAKRFQSLLKQLLDRDSRGLWEYDRVAESIKQLFASLEPADGRGVQ
jgi:AbiV family abortive infection protein